MEKYIDLHVHTTMSDGMFNPKQIIQYAKKNNIYAISITDHDTIDGIPTALFEAQKEGINLISGIELNAKHENAMHILGYFIDHESETFIKKINELKMSRKNGLIYLCRELKKKNINISPKSIMNMHGKINKYLIEKEILNKGYSIEPYIKDMLSFHNDYMSGADVISFIKVHRGISILAHPSRLQIDNVEMEYLIKSLKNHGLDGIEIYHPDINKCTRFFLQQIAYKYGLIETGGSDFHDESVVMGTYNGNDKVPQVLYEKLLNYFNKHQPGKELV